MLEVELYKDSKGKVPFVEWLEHLKDIQARAKVKIRVDRLRLGNFGDCRSVGEGVSELKIDFGPGYRVYFGRVGTKIVVLLLGGDKKTQLKDIHKAKEFWQHYKGINHVQKK